MFLSLIVKLLITLTAFSHLSHTEDIPYPEYDLGIVLKILQDSIGNTIDLMMHGEFPLDKIVTYHCRTPSRLETIQVFKSDLDLATKLDLSKKLILIIHGYTDNKDRRWIRRMVRDIPAWTDANACIVDWSKMAAVEYSIAANHVNKVGEEVGNFLLSIEQQVPLGQVSILGHSLGAHVAGAAGAKTGSKIDAIFGIDPAHPLITIPMRPPTERLDPTDAQFVQVLHTTSGVAGTPFNIGHQDWYADDGKSPQKGCEPGLIIFDPDALSPVSLSCSHIRAVEIFRFALDPTIQFRALLGDDVYGYWSRRTPGVFAFTTQRNRPYAVV